MRIEAHFNCFGYWGCGGGWEIRNSRREPDGRVIYCNRCPLRLDCWQRHRQRVRECFPDASAAFDAILDGSGEGGESGQVAVQRFSELHQSVPPDIVVFKGNIEDGSRVALGIGPKDRGPYTITFPFSAATQI